MACAVPGCRNTDIELLYCRQRVCPRHWQAHCNSGNFNLKQELRIKEKPHQPTLAERLVGLRRKKAVESIPDQLQRIRAMRERGAL